jgi:hypothetical protein
LNDLEISSVRTTPGFPSDTDLNATRHRRYYALRHIYAGSDSRSQRGREGEFEAMCGLLREVPSLGWWELMVA